MSLTATYDATLSRIMLTATGLDTDNTDAIIERTLDGGITYAQVRGASAVPVVAGELGVTVSDYEFVDGVPNQYRVTGNQELDRLYRTITPALDTVWIKSIARPFLNRPITVVGWSDITRAARGGEFDVVGRSMPVAVTDVRSSKAWTLDVSTADRVEADALDLTLAAGDVMLIHVPADCAIPGGYVNIGDTTERRTNQRGQTRVFSLPCREVATPGPAVIGSTSTWTSVLATYGDWSAVAAAHLTWADLLTLIGDPSEVIVP